MKLSRRRFIKRLFYAGLGLAFLESFWVERYFVDFTYHKIGTENDHRIRIVQLTDLHLNYIGWGLTNAIQEICHIQPDLIVLTGDVIEKKGKLDHLATFLKMLPMAIPKVAILGNWEHWCEERLDLLKNVYEDNQVTLLRNENTSCRIKDKTIAISGCDDWRVQKADYKKAVSNLDTNDFHLLLTHCPVHKEEVLQEKGEEQIDLILSGHTHGGQITFFGKPLFIPSGCGHYMKGWFHEGNIPHYVCKGVGTSTVPFRLGARSEIAVFDVYT